MLEEAFMKALIFDNETTGLLNHPDSPLEKKPRVIEFGGILVDENCNVLDELSILIDPGETLETFITKITGITDSDLIGKPLFSKAFKKINKIMRKADVVFAHNLPFDKNVLDYECQRVDKILHWPKYQICTVQMNVPKYGYRVKLKDLYQDVIGKSFKQTHRALDDTMMLLEIIKKAKYLETLAAAIKS